MTMNGTGREDVTIEYVHGRTIALESEIDEIKRETSGIPKLVASVNQLTHQVRTLGQAVGLRTQTQLPDDWEDITQVRRPELHALRTRAEENERKAIENEQRADEQEKRARMRTFATAGTAVLWALYELIRAVVDGRIVFH